MIHILKPIKSTQIVVMHIKSYAVMMIDTQNLLMMMMMMMMMFDLIEELMPGGGGYFRKFQIGVCREGS